MTVLTDGAFFVRLLLDLLAVVLLVSGVYRPRYGRTDLFLTFFGFNLVIFLIAFSLSRVEIALGAAFGLFAVFSMLRYRTEDISATDMTYLFLVIALGLLMATSEGGVPALATMAGLVLGLTWLLESELIWRRELAQDVWFDDLRLLPPARRDELLAALQARTGLAVHRVEVRQVDLLRDAARLVVYHYPAQRTPAGRAS
jgi:hypothetical protein